MSVIDRLVDAWVWFARDPEASIEERANEIIEIVELVMEAWFPLLLAGVVGFYYEPDARLEAAMVTLLGAIGLALWVIPFVGVVFVADVVVGLV